MITTLTSSPTYIYSARPQGGSHARPHSGIQEKDSHSRLVFSTLSTSVLSYRGELASWNWVSNPTVDPIGTNGTLFLVVDQDFDSSPLVVEQNLVAGCGSGRDLCVARLWVVFAECVDCILSVPVSTYSSRPNRVAAKI